MTKPIIIKPLVVPSWNPIAYEQMWNNSVLFNVKRNGSTEAASIRFVGYTPKETSDLFLKERVYDGRTGSTVSESKPRYYASDDSSVDKSSPLRVIKKNKEPELNELEFKVANCLRQAGIRVPEMTYSDGVLSMEVVGNTSLADRYETMSIEATLTGELPKERDEWLSTSFDMLVGSSKAVAEGLSQSDKNALQRLEYARVAKQTGVSIESAVDNYFLLKMLSAIPGETGENVDLFTPVADILKKNARTQLAWDVDIHPGNIYFDKDEKLTLIDFNRVRLLPRQIQIARLIDAYTPVLGFMSALPISSTTFAGHSAAQTEETKILNIGAYEGYWQRANGYFPDEKRCDEFEKGVPAARFFTNLMAASKSLQELSVADSWGQIQRKLLETTYHYENSIVSLGRMARDNPDSQDDLIALARFVDTKIRVAYANMIPTNVLNDIDHWNTLS